MNTVEIFFQNGTRSITTWGRLEWATGHAGVERAALGYCITRILVNGKDF